MGALFISVGKEPMLNGEEHKIIFPEQKPDMQAGTGNITFITARFDFWKHAQKQTRCIVIFSILKKCLPFIRISLRMFREKKHIKTQHSHP